MATRVQLHLYKKLSIDKGPTGADFEKRIGLKPHRSCYTEEHM